MKRGWANYLKDRHVSEERMYSVIKRPLITEKTTGLGVNGQVAFEVSMCATKLEIKAAVEKIFKVSVIDVNTLIRKGKNKVFRGRKGSRSDMKKAYVTVKEGQFIDVTAGL